MCREATIVTPSLGEDSSACSAAGRAPDTLSQDDSLSRLRDVMTAPLADSARRRSRRSSESVGRGRGGGRGMIIVVLDEMDTLISRVRNENTAPCSDLRCGRSE
jgi:hypothetical protein